MTFVDEMDQEGLDRLMEEKEEDTDDESGIRGEGKGMSGLSSSSEGPLIRCSAKDRVRTATIDK